MKSIKKLLSKVNTRMGFFLLLVFLFWIKTIFAYFTDFTLGVNGIFQLFILLLNPIATSVILLGLALYLKPAKLFYPGILFLDFLNTVLLYLNVIYFREFTDFMTVSTMTGYSKVNQGLSGSSLALTDPHDLFYWADIVIVILLLIFRVIKIDKKPLRPRVGFAVFSLGSLMFFGNLTLAEMDRPQLLTRTFDRSYIVKYLGIDSFTAYDGLSSLHTNNMRDNAHKSNLNGILKFNHENYAAPNPKMYGMAKGKNVIIIHLESFQQFLIDKKINGQEVTPFLNKLYHSRDTYAFNNFFHQVGQGKTSDAENLLETSTFGLPQGSLFAQLGSDNTFQSVPAILGQRGYSSAVFHGNVASFWNRNNTYKNMGYDNFFDASYYDTSGDKSTGYGLKDKLLFKDSTKYLQHLQQPFYVKYITVTNHFPYQLDSEDADPNFKGPNTNDQTVNNYFVTAHYLDSAVKEYYGYLKRSGLLKNSMIILYGDHYGISNAENPSLAPLLGKNPNDWNGYDDAQLQRVPFMINMKGIKNGRVLHTYGGEIDVAPTLLHLLGVSTKKYIQFGTDLFSKHHNQVVAFRNRDWVSPKYTSVSGVIYDSKTGKVIHPDKELRKKLDKIQHRVNQELSLSDELNEQNLLRFYHPKGFLPVKAQNYNYSNEYNRELKKENQLGKKSNSLFSRNGYKNTVPYLHTDAPEIYHKSTNSNRIKITNPDSSNN